MRAISAPPRRPEQLIRMPSGPRRIADCTARFMARRKATRRSSCCAIDSATRVASSSGLRISTMLMTTSEAVMSATRLRSLSMSAPFLPITTPGRAEWIVTRHFLCGRSITMRATAACLSSLCRISHFLTSTAIRLRENCRSASAADAFRPRINCATRLSFCGLTRSIRATALASLSARTRSRFGLLIVYSSSLLGFLVARMAMEGTGRRELAELVTHHFLVDRYRHMLLAVVDAERQADELRQDGRAAAPDLDDVVTAGRARSICLLEQRGFDERAFPD